MQQKVIWFTLLKTQLNLVFVFIEMQIVFWMLCLIHVNTKIRFPKIQTKVHSKTMRKMLHQMYGWMIIEWVSKVNTFQLLLEK